MNNVSYKDLISTLMRFLGDNKKKFLVWNLPIIVANIFYLIQPLLIGLIIDFFIGYSTGDSLKPFFYYLLILLVGTIVAEVCRISARGAMFEISADLEYNIKTEGFASIQNNSLQWQSEESSGNKVQRLETGKNAMITLVDFIKEDLYYIVINVVVISIVFYKVSPSFLILFLVYAVLQLLLFRFWNKKNPEYLERLNSAKESSVGKLFEGLTNVQTIKSLGASKSFQVSIDKSQDNLRHAIKDWERLGVYKWISLNSLNVLFLVLFFILIGFSVVNGIISVGFIFVLYTYFEKLQSITRDITDKVENLVKVRLDVQRMLPLFESINFNRGKDKFPKRWDFIEIKDATFEYGEKSNEMVFQKTNIRIKNGEFIGVVGESGSGKSSLLKILLGLYPIKSGGFKVGEKNFYDISHEEIVDNVTVVLQETELFNVSLLDNITMFKEVDAELLSKAIEISMLEDVIDGLSDNLNTIIGEKGVKFSGGQRQRIGIARAIYNNSQILLLDEATSNLDLETEKKVMEGIHKEFKEKTIIAVAHRLSTLEGADEIYEFKNRALVRRD